MSEGKWNKRFDSFSGKESDWYRWSKKFLSYANMEGYSEILTNTKLVVPKHDEDLDGGSDTKILRRKQNNMAYHDL